MHTYNESWRKHIDKHTIDLRDAKKAQPAKNNNSIDVNSQQTQEQVMRRFAMLTPAEMEQTAINAPNQEALEEYAEALQRSLYEQKHATNASNNIRLADAPARSTSEPHPHQRINRHSLLQELTAELASVQPLQSPIPPPQPKLVHPQPVVLTPQPQPQSSTLPPPAPKQRPRLDANALLADIPNNNSQTLDKKLSSFAYGPSIDGGEIVHALTAKAKKSFIKKILIVFIAIVGAVALVGAGFVGGKLVNAQQYAKEYAQQGYTYMESGKDALLALNASEARANFQHAYQAFNNIEDTLGFFSRTAISLADVVPFENNITSSTHLLDAGKLYAQTGIQASLALSQAQNLQNAEVSLSSSDRYNDIQSIIQHFENAQQHFGEANDIVATIHPDNIPAEFHEQSQDSRARVFPGLSRSG